MTIKPQLWRVHSYFGPGLPKPTINHIALKIEDRGSKIENGRSSSISDPRSSILDPRSSIFYLRLLFSLALLNHFRLGGGLGRDFGRRLFDSRRDQRHDDGLRVVARVDLGGAVQIADLEIGADAQGRHVNFND